MNNLEPLFFVFGRQTFNEKCGVFYKINFKKGTSFGVPFVFENKDNKNPFNSPLEGFFILPKVAKKRLKVVKKRILKDFAQKICGFK